MYLCEFTCWIHKQVAATNAALLSAFAKFKKKGEHSSRWTDFHEIWYVRIILKSFEKMQDSLKSDKNNRYFTWRPTYIYDKNSPNSS